MNTNISSLLIYPVKSLGGLPADVARICHSGFQFDRRWMLVDDNFVFLTQRQIPAMAELRVGISGRKLTISHLTDPTVQLEIPMDAGLGTPPCTVTVWDDILHARRCGAAFDEWFSTVLGRPCSLVFLPEGSLRFSKNSSSDLGRPMHFGDSQPLLVIGQASLDWLNQQLHEPVGMDRFRPNIVVDTTTPFEEDRWTRFRIGNEQFTVVKRCGRCSMVNIDQAAGKAGQEPLRTLARLRSFDNKILFGILARWECKDSTSQAELRVGHEITPEFQM
jgi:hypothetical protein